MENNKDDCVELFKGYFIYKNGDIFSTRSGYLRKLKPYINPYGYKVHTLSGVGKKVHMHHRLIAESFIPNPFNKAHVNHIDGDRINNEISNLEWCTPLENSQHAVKMGIESGRIKGKVELKCDFCGSTFMRWSCHVENNKKKKTKNNYCNHKCFNSNRAMNIYTEKKQQQFDLIGKIKADFYAMKSMPGAMKTPIYAQLAEKYGLSTRTISTYLKK